MSNELHETLSGYTDAQLAKLTKSKSASAEKRKAAQSIIDARAAGEAQGPEKPKPVKAAKAKKDSAAGGEAGRGRKPKDYPTIDEKDQYDVGATVEFRQVKGTAALEKGAFYTGTVTHVRACPKTALPFYSVSVSTGEAEDASVTVQKLHTSLVHNPGEKQAMIDAEAARTEKAIKAKSKKEETPAAAE